MSEFAIDARAVQRAFAGPRGRIEVLRGLDLQVAAGERVAVLGRSGSGKSTLLGLLAGLDRPDGGSVAVAGQDLAGLSAGALAAFRGRRIGIVFQSFRLLPTLSAAANVAVPLRLAGIADSDARVATWLERVGLADRSDHPPGRLSGGEQQRVALARALAGDPALVLADEPTGNLDDATAEHMAELLFTACGGHGPALLLVTHDRQLAQRCDRVLALREGRLEPA